MKVIRRGEDKEFYINCPKCDADLAYTKNDIHPVIKQTSMGSCGCESKGLFGVQYYSYLREDEFDCIACPECGYNINVPFSLPRHISTRKVYDAE